ncbi:hypothetical protein IMSAGC018_02150 [Lachnospiraceae bacterium]|nr:hypothetical protein IMSAGC018_02150 [Lachnospiraceae bacterium]
MRLNFSPSLQINNVFQSYQINRSAAGKAGVSRTESSEEERRDIFTLSPKGKAMNLINNLMKQKMEITDRKNSLIASTLEKGSSMETIKSQLEAYDEQLENIDVQITEAMAKELEKKEDKDKVDNTPKTQEELENERLTDIVTLSGDVQNISMLDSVKTKVDRRINILESEISRDNGRLGAADFKKEELSKLKKNSAKLASDIGSRMADIAEEIHENNEKTPEKESNETDTMDVSSQSS